MKTTKLLFAILLIITSTALNATELKVNTDKSNIHWVGKKIGGEHSGDIKLKIAILEIEADVLRKGEFVIDMNSMTNTDIENLEYREKLMGHLKSDDFFGTETFPIAILKVSTEARFNQGTAKVNADLMIKGQTYPISFNVIKRDGNYYATLEIDRSKYDIRYGSRSFFDNLGDKAIHDNFTLEIVLVID